MKALTKRQSQVLDIIKTHLSETGMPPTRVEIAKELGFRSANAAEEHLKALARKGVITMVPGASRGIRLVEKELDAHRDLVQESTAANDEQGLPLVGQVAAGEPILAQQHIESHYKVDPALFHPHADFLLRVRGESMKNIGIMDGDLLAVHKTQDIYNGQVVVARVGDDVTVKRFEKQSDKVMLYPENDDFAPIVVDPSCEELAIEGLAVGIIRNSDWF
ncbi:transcriptional repressor LexA [Celerinatantimonas diazotrophica]|uniref:LexA repressor n=1 Tax=Celerinatantimonas diazotrophica TaxID=412034 RepID=A0A4R1J8V2_9GAMM|nr:transcriptional repressor LexA [Celerinatantimonas diazotrophica]TCK46784.1 SOS-response transcriptional repressor LexA [Celerinatantimonas diazotrophica]CAG9295487.1 LexA repressor [Celerinatantimonas diazotrophica]